MSSRNLGILIIYLTVFLHESRQDVHVGVDLVTKLSNNLVQTVFKEGLAEKENSVFSPFGLFSSLAMVLEASNGESKQEILRALNISSDDVVNVRKGFKAYCDLFSKYSNEPEAAGSFTAASAIGSFDLSAGYKEILRTYYCANVSEGVPGNGSFLELSSIAGVMSHWKDYEKLAVYTFLSHRSLIPFRKRDGTTESVTMIPQVGVFRSKIWENAQIVLLPLQAKLVSLLLIIPGKPEDLNSIVTKMSEQTIPLLIQSLPKQEMEIFVPQMAAVSKHVDLSSFFSAKGIHTVFDEKKSNLSKASSDPEARVTLRKVEQNAYFSTSFTALNSVSGISASLGVHKRTKRNTKKFYVDQPFIFFVLQKDTQLALLAGKVENPNQIPV